MDTSPTSRMTVFSVLRFLFMGVLNGLMAALVGLALWYIVWVCWVAMVYRSGSGNEQMDGDDGGSSVGWALVLGVGLVLKGGFMAGVGRFLFLALRDLRRWVLEEEN